MLTLPNLGHCHGGKPVLPPGKLFVLVVVHRAKHTLLLVTMRLKMAQDHVPCDQPQTPQVCLAFLAVNNCRYG